MKNQILSASSDFNILTVSLEITSAEETISQMSETIEVSKVLIFFVWMILIINNLSVLVHRLLRFLISDRNPWESKPGTISLYVSLSCKYLKISATTINNSFSWIRFFGKLYAKPISEYWTFIATVPRVKDDRSSYLPWRLGDAPKSWWWRWISISI